MAQPGAPQGNSPIQGALRGMTVVMACASVIILTPQLDALTADFVYRWAAREYGPDLAQLMRIGWFFCVGAFVFYSSQLGFYAAAVMFASSAFFKMMPF